MMGVILVEQGDQDVDVQQGPQESDSQLFAKLVNELVGDDGPARRNGLKPYRARCSRSSPAKPLSPAMPRA